MARRFAVSVLLAVFVVLAGCSQLASTPNEPTDTATAAGANTTSAATTEATQTPTTTAVMTPSPTPTPSQTPTPTATPTSTPTATATPLPTPTATATPPPTPTPTATPPATQTPTPTPSPTVTSSPTPEPRFVVIIGGEPDDKVNYRLTVTGSIERRGQSYGAPIEDAAVTEDPAIDIISGSTVAGRLGGGGDAYRIIGEIVSFETEDESAVEVYIDGENVEFEDEEGEREE